MDTFEPRTPRGPAKARAAHDRDAALWRLSRTRRWVAGGAAVLTAAFAALVSTITPASKASASSQSLGTASSAGSTSGSGSHPKMPPLASASSLGLQAQPSASQSTPDQSAQSAPAQSAPAPTPAPSTVAPAPAASAPAAVSGGS
jgi:hypothetical protein